MERSSLDRVDSAVEIGYCVISADRKTILTIVQETVRSGRSATFYLPLEQAEAIMDWYWTPEQVKALKLEAVSPAEALKIERELGIKDAASVVYSNRADCQKCGHTYGAFEFIQQGIREHGKESVETALTLANTAVVRVNPSQVAICPNCEQRIPIGHYYKWDRYGCCSNVPM